jgi:hypothetical protein
MINFNIRLTALEDFEFKTSQIPKNEAFWAYAAATSNARQPKKSDFLQKTSILNSRASG